MWKLSFCMAACIVLLIVFQRWNFPPAPNQPATASKYEFPALHKRESVAPRSTSPATYVLGETRSSPLPLSSPGPLQVDFMPPAERAEVERSQTNFAKVISLYNAGQIAFDDVLAARKDRLEFLTGLANLYSDVSRDKLVDDEVAFTKLLLEHARQIRAPESQLKLLEGQVQSFEREIQSRAGNRLLPD